MPAFAGNKYFPELEGPYASHLPSKDGIRAIMPNRQITTPAAIHSRLMPL